MDHFSYRDGELCAEDLPLSAVADRFGTPTYVYSRATLERHYRAFDEAFAAIPHQVCYAVKANSNIAVLNVLARLGAGFDIVSGGELERVLAAGGEPEKVVFSGLGKQEADAAPEADEPEGPEGTKALRAPLQGTVINISVAAGEAVRAGQALMIMEAMKMEHVITADVSGIVRQVTVAAGDTVFEDHPLAFLEEAEIAGGAVGGPLAGVAGASGPPAANDQDRLTPQAASP